MYDTTSFVARVYEVWFLTPLDLLHLVAQLLAIEIWDDTTDRYPKDCGDHHNGHCEEKHVDINPLVV